MLKMLTSLYSTIKLLYIYSTFSKVLFRGIRNSSAIFTMADPAIIFIYICCPFLLLSCWESCLLDMFMQAKTGSILYITLRLCEGGREGEELMLFLIMDLCSVRQIIIQNVFLQLFIVQQQYLLDSCFGCPFDPPPTPLIQGSRQGIDFYLELDQANKKEEKLQRKSKGWGRNGEELGLVRGCYESSMMGAMVMTGIQILKYFFLNSIQSW